MDKKKKILIFIDWFTPAFKAGGPIKSVSNIVDAFQSNVEFTIITSDRDLNDREPFKNIVINQWIKKEKYKIIYLSRDFQRNKISQFINNLNYDTIYINSIFSKSFAILPLQLAKKHNIQEKVIVAPRGMLGQGALSIKPIKKKLFLSLAKITGLFKNIKWHATNIDELKDIQKVFGEELNYEVASNLCATDILDKPLTKEPGKLSLCFFSRISPKKNLDLALEVLKQIDTKVDFDIYGALEDDIYWKKIENKIDLLKGHNVKYKGPIEPINVKDVLSNYHFMFLPTKHENFGHVIFEAIAAGCGLIISNQTPWNKLQQKGIGWDIPLADTDQFKLALTRALEMNQDTYNQYRSNCISFVKDYLENSKDISDTAKLFDIND